MLDSSSFQGVVSDINVDTIHMKLGVNLKGYVRRLHNADVPIAHVAEKFAIGSTLKCRVSFFCFH
jgi:ribosomal protein S1